MGLHLPEEVLTLIVSFLELPSAHVISSDRVHTDKSYDEISPGEIGPWNDPDQDISVNLETLARLSSVSHALRRISEPYLYKVWPGDRLRDPRNFIAALAARPERASLVNEIVVDDLPRWLGIPPTYEISNENIGHGDEQMSMIQDRDGNVTFLDAATAVEQVEEWRRAEAEKRKLGPRWDTPLSDLYRSGLAYFQQVITSAPLLDELRSDLGHAIEEGHPEAAMSILLLTCSKHIEGFSFAPCNGFGSSLLWRTLTNQANPDTPGWTFIRNPCIIHGLERLQHLSLWMFVSDRNIDGIGLLAPLMYAQSLVCLHIDHAGFETAGNMFDLDHMARGLALSPHLRTLTMSDCIFVDDKLPLIQTATNLTSLAIVYDHKTDTVDALWRLSPFSTTINDCLPNLEHLTLDVWGCKPPRGKSPLISLGTHAHLKTITAHPATLLGPQPPQEWISGETSRQWLPSLTERLPRSIEQINFLSPRKGEVFSKDGIEQIPALLSSSAFERLQMITFEWRGAMKPGFLSDEGWQLSLQCRIPDGRIATYAIMRRVQHDTNGIRQTRPYGTVRQV